MRKVCEVCGPVEAQRSTAKYCSGRCRNRKYTGRIIDVPKPTLVTITPAQAEFVEREAVRSAHDAAGDLSRASRIAPAPRCLVYRELAETIEDKLGGIEA